MRFSFSAPESLSGHWNSERSRSQGQGLLFRGDRQGDSRSAGWRGSRNPQGEEGRSRRPQFRRARLRANRPSSEAVLERRGGRNQGIVIAARVGPEQSAEKTVRHAQGHAARPSCGGFRCRRREVRQVVGRIQVRLSLSPNRVVVPNHDSQTKTVHCDLSSSAHHISPKTMAQPHSGGHRLPLHSNAAGWM